MQGRTEDALYETERSLNRNWHNHGARTLRALLLLQSGRKEEAMALCKESLIIDPLNFGSLYVKYLISEDIADKEQLVSLLRGESHNYDELALLFL